MESAEEIMKDLVPKNPIFTFWPEKQKPTKNGIVAHKDKSGIPTYQPYYEKPKKACFCAIKRQMEKGKVMSAHLARQI